MSGAVRAAVVVACALGLVAFGMGVASVWMSGPARTSLGQTAALLCILIFLALLVAAFASDTDDGLDR